MRAQRGQRRQDLEPPEPGGEALDLVLDDRLGADRLGPAHAQVPADLRLQRVHVQQRHALDGRAQRVDVARDGQIDEQQRPPAAGLHHGRELLGLDDRVRRGGGGDDDVGALQLARQRVEGARVAAELLRQRDRALAPAVGDEHRRHAVRVEGARGLLGRLARADDHDVALGELAHGRAGGLDGDRGHGRVAGRDRGLGAHALAGGQRGAEELVGHRPGRARGQRPLVGALDLALDLGLADDHRLQPARPRGTGAAPRRSCGEP